MGLPSSFVRSIARRGLHDHQTGRIENSAAAFESAIAGGFGIECDVRPAARGLPIVFYDERATRLLGHDAATDTLSEDQLRELAYADGSRTMTYCAFLALVGGRVPVLAELKSSWSEPPTAFVAEVWRLSGAYEGLLALLSFDPESIAALRQRVPRVRRGLVVLGFDQIAATSGRTYRFCTDERASLAAFETAGASFAAHDVRELPTSTTEILRQNRRVPVFAWTIRSRMELQTARTWADAPIFEGDIVEHV